MKKLFSLLTLAIVSLAFSQQKATLLQVSLLEKSKAPLSTHIHNHTYTVKNTTSKDIVYTIQSKQVDCQKKSSKMSTSVFSEVNKKDSKLLIKANSSQTITVQMRRNLNTLLDTWSCIKITAINELGVPISNTSLLSQFIPDTNNFQ